MPPPEGVGGPRVVEYLSVDDVVQIIETFAEAPLREVVRDMGLLMLAVERPTLVYRGEDVYPTLPMKAAAFMESLAKSNALFDGNKRLAWIGTNVFLELNGAALHFSDNEIFSLVREIAQNYMTTADLTARLGVRMGPAGG